MRIIFPRTLLMKEAIGQREKEWLLKAVSKGIYKIIKGSDLPGNSELRKLYMTTVIGPRRAVFIVNLHTKDLFFLFLRSKKDPIGQNITIKNPLFKKTLHAYLTILREDIRNKNFDSSNL